MLYELPAIIETYATRFDQLPAIVGAPPNVRSLISRGLYSQLYFVAGKLNDDDTIELQTIEIELRPPTDT